MYKKKKKKKKKKAIMESDTQWSQNHKLIDTSEKGLRHIPKNFPYFYVEYAFDKGFAHVIEEADKFPRHFGKVFILQK